MGVLQAYSKQSSGSVKLRSLIDTLRARPEVVREEPPIPRHFTHLSAEQTKALAEDYRAGMRVKELAAKYGISRETISKHLRRHGIAPRKVGLDAQQIKEAVRLYEQGDSLATIGKRMGVTAHTVRSRLIEAGVKMRSSYEHLLSDTRDRKV
ncbi:hypothetical protein GCM10023346_31290 [Arthrobacter gyeryongensis]|uniref:Uncharacterized protein n=1 Tax=Arthrobacter gyeryongensis TaxID=1650592 RepID=A0ABP9SL05_9MICC